MRVDKWDSADMSEHLPNPDSEKEERAVYIGDHPDGKNVMIADETSEEWINFENLKPLNLAHTR